MSIILYTRMSVAEAASCMLGGWLQMTMPSPADLVDAVKKQLRSAAEDWPTLNIIVEPGRSLVGNAGTFVTKVLGWKQNGNRKYFTYSMLSYYFAIYGPIFFFSCPLHR